MYKEGDLKLVDPLPCDTFEKEYDCCDEPDHVHSLDDWRGDGLRIYSSCVFLPHSCDRWIIGGADNIKLLIKDLQEALKKIT